MSHNVVTISQPLDKDGIQAVARLVVDKQWTTEQIHAADMDGTLLAQAGIVTPTPEYAAAVAAGVAA